MKPKEPTTEQQEIIDYPGNLAVIARPGSGKTYTLSIKIKQILEQLPSYKGVIAISYTNKASNELKQRSLSGGIDSKSSFFGTIDNFFLREIIFPFLPRLFGNSSIDVVTKKMDEIPIEERNAPYNMLVSLIEGKQDFDSSIIEIIKDYYHKGIIFLELDGHIGLYIYEQSKTLQNYLKAKYTHIIIDEFQDSGLLQYQLFCRLVDNGIIGIAVGDIDQAIYGFAKKSSEYLLALQNKEGFTPFKITRNHRCHTSIVNYSQKLLSSKLTIEADPKSKVLYKCVNGSQTEIAHYIDKVIPQIKTKLNILHNREIAILVKSYISGGIIDKNLKTPHKYITNTILDESSDLWARLFVEILYYLFDEKALLNVFIDNWIIDETDKRDERKLINKMKSLKKMNPCKLQHHLSIFEEIAKLLYPKDYSINSLTRLEKVLKSDSELSSYFPIRDDEVQIMTIHKSKGLEFDAVFHLDLYKFIIPKGSAEYGYDNWQEDLNLHYVALTRAKKVCFMVGSSRRINSEQKFKDGIPSIFLSINKLDDYRQNIRT